MLKRGECISILRAWVLAALLALFLAGCAGYVDPGPNPAKVRVLLKAEAKQQPKSWRAGGPYPVTWDWGLYLVQGDASLAQLKPADGQRLKVIEANPLVRDTVFLVPPGRRDLRLMLEAYYFQPHAEGSIPVSLGGTIMDFQVDVPQGGEKSLKVDYPEP